MAVRKTYRSLGGNPLSIDITVKGTLQSVNFTGGMKYPILRLPSYTTTDPEEQLALEDYPGYKSSYALVNVEVFENIVPDAPYLVIDPNKIVGEFADIVLPSFVAARIYAKETLNLDVKYNTRKEQILQAFKDNGLNLIIEDKQQTT